MKTSLPILILFVLASFTCASAQGSILSFSQVLSVSQADTVPAGKVWKIESAPYKNDVIGTQGSWNSQNPTVEYVQSMLIDGNTVYIQALRIYDGSWRTFTGPTCQFPLWLPAGTVVQPSTGVRFLSVLEFNVIAQP